MVQQFNFVTKTYFSTLRFKGLKYNRNIVFLLPTITYCYRHFYNHVRPNVSSSMSKIRKYCYLKLSMSKTYLLDIIIGIALSKQSFK